MAEGTYKEIDDVSCNGRPIYEMKWPYAVGSSYIYSLELSSGGTVWLVGQSACGTSGVYIIRYSMNPPNVPSVQPWKEFFNGSFVPVYGLRTYCECT